MNRIYTTLSSVALSVAAFTVSAELSPVQLVVGASPVAVVPASLPSRADEADKKPGEVDEAIVRRMEEYRQGHVAEDLLCAYEDFMDATGNQLAGRHRGEPDRAGLLPHTTTAPL